MKNKNVKILKRFYIVCLLIILIPMGSLGNPQDGRQRDLQTIVADGLAQLPISNPQKRNKVMAELANTGSKGIEMMANMLVPADKGKNATVEYAISGTVGYVTVSGNEQQRKNIRKGLVTSVDVCTDDANRAFLLSQLQLCSTTEDAPTFIKYLEDKYLSDYAIRGLVAMSGSDEIILDLMRQDKISRKVLAHAAGERNLVLAEPILLKWLNNADANTRIVILKALATCGTSASLKVLAASAKTEGFEWNKEKEATASYLCVLNRMASNEEKAVNAAKKLLKNKKAYLRGAALDVILSAKGTEGMSYVLFALKDKDIEVRNSALRSVSQFANDEVYASIAKWLPALSDDACVDVITWFGNRHTTSQIDVIVENMKSKNDALATAAISAAGRIGGSKALHALIAQLGEQHADKAAKALLAFNGNIKEGIRTALASNPMIQVQALKLASQRRIYEVAPQVFAMLYSDNKEVKGAAYNALSGVVQFTDVGRLVSLLEKADARNVRQLQKALKNAIKSQEQEKQYAIVASCMQKSSNPAIYYSILAQTGTISAIELLNSEFATKNENAAFNALLEVNNPAMIEILYKIAIDKEVLKEKALARYVLLTKKSSFTGIRKYQLYRQALDLSPSAKIQKQVIRALSAVRTFPSLILASKYLDNKEIAVTAAATVKTIIAKNEERLGGSSVKLILEKAQNVYRTLSDADAKYAVDEISNLLTKLPDADYKPLFDDTDVWNIDKIVSANWTAVKGGMGYAGGKSGKISTKKDYENFEMYLDWKTVGKAGIAVRSIPQIGLGVEGGSGGLIHESKPVVNADNKAGEWNTLYAKVVDDRITVALNGRIVTNNVVMENTLQQTSSINIKGAIELMGGGEAVEFRDLYIRELPSTPVSVLSPEEKAEGYEMLFDGTSLYKWTGNMVNYVPQNGTLYVSAAYGKGGNLYTKKEYSDFVFRFEFSFERDGVNNGVGIRTPIGVDAAYDGMEIQILDHDSPIYKGLHEYQQHGSVYGIIPAKRVKFGPLGSWNKEEIRVVGDQITVTVNGEVILEGNIREACQGKNVSEDGSKKNPYTKDHRNHPGLFNKQGHIGFLGHGVGIRFRNVRVLDLSTRTAPVKR